MVGIRKMGQLPDSLFTELVDKLLGKDIRSFLQRYILKSPGDMLVAKKGIIHNTEAMYLKEQARRG